MTEQLSEAPTRPERPAPEGPDFFLQILVQLANRIDGFPVQLTLNVGGSIISGDLVGGRLYFEAVKAMWTTDPTAENEVFNNFFEFLEAPYRLDDDEGTEAKQAHPHFIHLRNARFYTAGQEPIPANQGVWWRGRLAAIDGFCMGSLSTAPKT